MRRSEAKYQAKTGIKYQTARGLLYQAENEEEEAKYQAKTGIGTDYQAKAEARDQEEARYQTHQADNETPTGTIVKEYQAKKVAPVTRLELTYKHLPELHNIKKYQAKMAPTPGWSSLTSTCRSCTTSRSTATTARR